MDPQIYLDALEAEAKASQTEDDYEYANPLLAAGAQAMRQMGAIQREMTVQMQAQMQATAEMMQEQQRQQQEQMQQQQQQARAAGMKAPNVNPANPFEMFSFPFNGNSRW